MFFVAFFKTLPQEKVDVLNGSGFHRENPNFLSVPVGAKAAILHGLQSIHRKAPPTSSLTSGLQKCAFFICDKATSKSSPPKKNNCSS